MLISLDLAFVHQCGIKFFVVRSIFYYHFLATLQFRLSETPLRSKLGNINQVDPNIDATFLEPYSVETETLAEQSIESECDDVADVTAMTSTSVNAALSPGMSNEMQLAIKTYLKSISMYHTNSLELKAEQLNVVDNVAEVEKSTDTEESNISVSSWSSQERVAENNSEDFVKVDSSVSDSELSVRTNEAKSSCGLSCGIAEMNDVFEASLNEVPTSSPVLQVKNAEPVPSITPKHFASQVAGRLRSPNISEDLTLSARKNKVFAARNLKLDKLSSPLELASYAEERAQNYSFLINEAYCEKSVFCENCYAMRIELGVFSDKFAALTAIVRGPAAEANAAFVVELENLLRGKQAEIVTLSSKLRDLTLTNDELSKQKEIAEKDAEDYRFLFQDEMKKKLEEINALRNKLYEAGDLIDKLKQPKLKQSSNEDISQVQVKFDASSFEGCQMEVRIKIMEQQLNTAHSLHREAQQRIEELEGELQKVVEEKDLLSLKFQKELIDLENKNDGTISHECKDYSIVSVLKAKVAELGNKIDEVLRVKENESVKQKSYLFEKLASLIKKIRTDVESNAFAGNWEADDVEVSINYFEKAVDIICQDIPQFETLIETVALHGKLAKDEFKKLEATMEEVMEEKKKWETLFINEKSRLDSLQEMMLAQFCENKNFFSNLLQDFQSKWTDILCFVNELAKAKSEENQNCATLEMLHHIADLQEKSKEKQAMDSNELKKCSDYLQKQHLIVASLQSEIQETNDKIVMLHESIAQNFKNSSALLDSWQSREAKQESLMDFVKSQLEHYEKEKDVFDEKCKHSEEMMKVGFFRESCIISYYIQSHVLKKTVKHLQKVEKDIRSQNTVLCKNLDSGFGNFASTIQIAENFTREKDKLEDENAALKNTTEKMSIQQNKKFEELEHRLNLLQKENERLEIACDDADDEVSDLKQQIFELLRVNAKLQAQMRGESEEAVNRIMGCIEPPTIRPTIHLSPRNTASGMNSLSAKVANVTETLQKSKADVKIEKVLVKTAEAEERKELRRLEEEENVLGGAANVLAKKIPAKESPKSNAIQDESCRTS
uniref:TATA element modulatory factor n=1 Tax=Elaeophora elaphi TaxID=1147741 RepID=A0A0R3RR31_9BILA